jgi:AcrR family transcriptional regulator
MNQEERTERSRKSILDAALKLFSHRGFRSTSIRDIAQEAEVSTGNVYHHFTDKDAIFEQLLGQYWKAIETPDFQFNTAMAAGFPDHLEEIGRGAHEMVRKWRPYIALIYVDVVEFDGKHIRKFYSEMARRYEKFLASHREQLHLDEKLRPGVDPVSAIMLASRVFLNYFSIEILFGVPNHFGQSTEEIISELSDLLRHGILKPEATPPKRRGPSAR